MKNGATAIATSRNSKKLDGFKDASTSAASSVWYRSYTCIAKENFLALDLDVTDQKSVDAAFEKATKAFGRVDVGQSFVMLRRSIC